LYYTPEAWAKAEGFDPPLGWLDAMNAPKRGRDVARMGVYDAEALLFAADQPRFALDWAGPPYYTEFLRTARDYLAPIWDFEVRQAFGGFVPLPKLVITRSRRMSGCFTPAMWQISLRSDANKHTLLHELAHALTPGTGHGAEFIRVSRRLYKNCLGIGAP
jgi:hypothetical protein